VRPSGSGAAVREGAPGIGALGGGRTGVPDDAVGVGATREGRERAALDGAATRPPLGGSAAGRGDAGSAIPPEYEGYIRALRARVQERLAYPWLAVRRGQQGTVELEVRLGPDGRLASVQVVGDPGADSLAAAALRAVHDAAPFPFPDGLAPRPLVVRLPIVFRLR
jgi:protein TonB